MIKLSDKKLCIVGFQYFYIIDAQLKQLETKVFAHTELIFSVLNLNVEKKYMKMEYFISLS